MAAATPNGETMPMGLSWRSSKEFKNTLRGSSELAGKDSLLRKLVCYVQATSKPITLCGCRPERLFMIAIDGVAPQAKMCQQRTRRFMSAHTEQLRKGIEKEVFS